MDIVKPGGLTVTDKILNGTTKNTFYFSRFIFQSNLTWWDFRDLSMDILYYSIKIKRFNYRLVHISLEVPVDPRKELPIDTNYLGSLRSEPIQAIL